MSSFDSSEGFCLPDSPRFNTTAASDDPPLTEDQKIADEIAMETLQYWAARERVRPGETREQPRTPSRKIDIYRVSTPIFNRISNVLVSSDGVIPEAPQEHSEAVRKATERRLESAELIGQFESTFPRLMETLKAAEQDNFVLPHSWTDTRMYVQMGHGILDSILELVVEMDAVDSHGRGKPRNLPA
ncbi:hypothetical protein C8J57DRAFT_1247601 [Mycena rebaudengoi]|nr:hypothetical protein C8J57DRAFT_1247601 [Mycena rebaudengoi]